MLILLAPLLCVLAARSQGAEQDWIGWHQKVGIVEVENIRRAENILFGPSNPIVGGALAPVNAHPYLAGILIDLVGLTGPSACGGSLLSSSKVLTAAHCWYDGRFYASKFTVVLGSAFLFHGGLRIPTVTIGVHPQYEARTLANDIAMLYLPVHVPFSNTIRPIALPTGRFQHMEFTGVWTRASGYGRYSDLTNPTTNTMVRHVMLPTIPLSQCRGIYGNIVLDSNICTSGTGGVGICQGDSGGPLTINSDGEEILIGVSSFVAQIGCEKGFPSVFARVTSFIEWIQWHM